MSKHIETFTSWIIHNTATVLIYKLRNNFVVCEILMHFLILLKPKLNKETTITSLFRGTLLPYSFGVAIFSYNSRLK